MRLLQCLHEVLYKLQCTTADVLLGDTVGTIILQSQFKEYVNLQLYMHAHTYSVAIIIILHITSDS